MAKSCLLQILWYVNVMGWIESLKKIWCCPNSQSFRNVILFGNGVIEDVIRWGCIGAGWVPSPIRLLSLQEDGCVKKGDPEEKAMWRWRQTLEWCSYKPCSAKDSHYSQRQRLGEGHGADSLRPQKEPVLLICWFWTFSL
jgi:hypothetical protein